jgi:oligopeptidase B
MIRHRHSWVYVALALFAATRAAAQASGDPSAAPVAERRPHRDTMWGEVRPDDYFWLRHKPDPDVRAYLEQENGYADRMLAPIAGLRDTLYREMLARIKQTDLSVPYRERGYYYYSRTLEGQQYPIYCRKRGTLEAPEEILLDLNQLAVGRTFIGLGAYTVSDDNNLLAYSLDTTGFRQYVLFVKDLRTGRDLADHAWPVTSVAWAADNRTLFYAIEDTVTKRSYRLYRHLLGGSGDVAIHDELDERFSVGVARTRSGGYLVMPLASLTTSEVRVLRADAPATAWRTISPRRQDREYSLDHRGDRFWIMVNDRGRNFRLVTAPVANPAEANWREVIAHDPAVMLEDFDLFADYLVVSTRHDGLQQLRVTDLRTNATHEIAFPEPVYSAFTSTNREWNTSTLRYGYQSFVTPSSVFDYDMATRHSTLLKQTEVLGGYDPARYASERVYATAHDGVRVPISLVYRRDVARDGRAPMLLTAYGSYGSSSAVTFSSARLSLLDRGVVFALAHIRGGGEMGKAWHDNGRMLHKMNTFTDFIASAEHLIAERYTSASRLAIQGGSAGGLLMGAVTNLRPDLFHAVVANVPFVDVINTMADSTLPLTVGEFEEWGNPRIEAEYRYIRQYSPYDNIARRDYPAMLVTTSFNDSQVLYHEPAKYVARMRALRTDHNPLIFTINMGAGHGGASGRYDRLREVARDYGFMLWQIGATAVP